MLYVNGKHVDFTDMSSDYQFRKIVDEFHQNINSLKEKHGDIVLFVTPSREIKLDPITKIPRRQKPYSWPYTTTVFTDGSTQEWVYSASAAKVKDGVATPSDPNFIVARGERSLTTSADADLIFFLQHTNAFKKGKLKIHDPEKVERERAEKMVNENKIKDLLYSESSVLIGDRDKLNIVSGKWGVSNASGMTIDALRNQLYDTVLSGEDQRRKGIDGARGIKDFILDVEGTKATGIGSDVQYAMDKGVLHYDKGNGQWKVSAANTDVPIVLMNAGKTSARVARELLIEFLVESKDDYDVLQKAIHGGVNIEYGKVVEKDPADTAVYPDGVTLENLYQKDEKDKYVVKFATLQKALKQMGAAQFGGKDEEVRAKVQARLEEMIEQEA